MNDVKVEINLKQIVRNIKSMRAKLASGVLFCAVVKANAYSFDDVTISQAIQNHVDMFAVARMSEAIRLREQGKVVKPILLLCPCEDFKSAIDHNITVTISSIAEMHMACKASLKGKINIHIEVNTGMNRFGVNTLWQLRTIMGLAHRHKNIDITGLYTHMASIKQTDKQLKRFAPFKAMLKRFHPRAIIHAACSEGVHLKQAQLDMVRIGKAMYGGISGYKSAVTIKAKIVAVQHLKSGDNVGYGGLFTAVKSCTVGVVNCGYANAGFLLFAPPTHIYVGKVACKILGSVCMDTIFIDATDLPSPLGKSITILDDLNQTDQSSARLLCSIR